MCQHIDLIHPCHLRIWTALHFLEISVVNTVSGEFFMLASEVMDCFSLQTYGVYFGKDCIVVRVACCLLVEETEAVLKY